MASVGKAICLKTDKFEFLWFCEIVAWGKSGAVIYPCSFTGGIKLVHRWSCRCWLSVIVTSLGHLEGISSQQPSRLTR